jgi:tetraacyldisaccharide 4'-kinase
MSFMPWLAQRLPDVWLHRGPLAWLLWPVSLLYGLLVAIRLALYRLGILQTQGMPVPVIVVGNVVAGGSGKTPVVMALVQHLQAQGWHPGVISRGYGRDTRDCREVMPDARAIDTGDEPLLIRQKTGAPVFVAAKRVDAALALLHKHPSTDVLVCDDGLQHLALERDIEICVFDERGVGNGLMLPAGPLREPWPRKVDLMLNSSAVGGVPGAYSSSRQLSSHARRADGSVVELATLGQHRPLAAVAGIAKPDKFFSMLAQCGIQPDVVVPLPDHFDYTQPIRQVQAARTLLCTEKDAVKLWRTTPHAWAVALECDPDPGFFNALTELLRAAQHRKLAKLSSRHGSSTT